MSVKKEKSYIEDIKTQVLDKANASEDISVDPSKTLLLVVDMVNDGNREEGFFGKGGSDISMALSIEDTAIDIINKSKDVSLPVCYVKPVYDFSYLLEPMREQFNMSGLPDMLYKKGKWGSEFVDTLPEPDLCLVKSHFSSFSPHSFVFDFNSNSLVKEYIELPEEKDSDLKAENKKVMFDYFEEAQRSQTTANKNNMDDIMKDKVVSLDTYLKCKGIDTLIIIGGSTHVCVDAAVSAATERGYKVILPVDALCSEDYAKHWIYLHTHSIFKGIVSTTEKVKFTKE